jgi:lysozyme
VSARTDAHVARLKARGWDWPIPWETVEQIARKEDCRLDAYPCIAGKPTIGWGETENIRLSMRWTEDQADARFHQQVRKYAARVDSLCAIDPTPNQLGAMTSLAYNIGFGDPDANPPVPGFRTSTVLRQHNAGNPEAASRAFGLWNKATINGALQEVRGLTLRRAAEATLYLTPEPDAPGERMPQAVEAESTMAKSPIVRDGAFATAGGAALAVAPLADQLGQASGLVATVKAFAQQVSDFIGVPLPYIAAGVVIYAGVNVIRWRLRQRQQGWA